MDIEDEVRDRALGLDEDSHLDVVWEDEDDGIDEYERDLEDGRRHFFCLKWVADDARTPEEAAEMIESFATELRRLGTQGFVLEHPVDNGHFDLVQG